MQHVLNAKINFVDSLFLPFYSSYVKKILYSRRKITVWIWEYGHWKYFYKVNLWSVFIICFRLGSLTVCPAIWSSRLQSQSITAVSEEWWGWWCKSDSELKNRKEQQKNDDLEIFTFSFACVTMRSVYRVALFTWSSVYVVVTWIPRQHGWREDVCDLKNKRDIAVTTSNHIFLILNNRVKCDVLVWLELGEGEGSSGSSVGKICHVKFEYLYHIFE